MKIIIKPDASPTGDIKVEAGDTIYYFPKGMAHREILSEVTSYKSNES